MRSSTRGNVDWVISNFTNIQQSYYRVLRDGSWYDGPKGERVAVSLQVYTGEPVQHLRVSLCDGSVIR